ncbi:MAG: DNA-binding response regulator [Tardiphaga sp.]|jgi:two-component system invasion response regulator UvrY|nr:DNA-binding response regulator [Tardiphaga sp.]
MTAISILLVDDHPVVREGYRRLLERQPGYRVIAEAEDAATAYRAYQRERADVVVMDLSLPGPGGLEAIRHIRQRDRAARVLVFTMHASAAFALKAFEAGARGYITKSSAPQELVQAIAIVARGGRALSEDIAREIAAERLGHERSLIADLGPRETEILRLLASGWTTEQIATSLNLSGKTVQNYHYQIKSKIGARTDAHLVWLAVAAGLVAPENAA